MARLFPRFEKHVYYVGEVNLVDSSTPYTPINTMYFKGARVTLDTAPSGSGSTVVNLIRNGDTQDVIYSVTFAVGESSKTITTEASLSSGDTMSLNISSVASTSGGSDLIFALEYHN